MGNFEEILKNMITNVPPLPKVTGFESKTLPELEDLLNIAMGKVAMANDTNELIMAMDEEDKIKAEMEKKNENS